MKPAKRHRWFRSGLLYGCLPILVFGSLVFGWLWLEARARLRERSAILEKEVAAFDEAMSKPRPVLFGEAEPGNATDEYWLIGYVLGSPESWGEKIPVKLAPTKYIYDHQEINKIACTIPSARLLERVKSGDRSVPTGAQARFLKAYGPLADHVRMGLRKERCRWDSDVFGNAAVNIPNANRVANIAKLMAYQAFMAEEGADIEKALEVLAFGRDVARHPTCIMAMLGVAIQDIGFSALSPILMRRQSAASYRQVLAVLDALESIDIERALIAGRLTLALHLADLSGDPIYEPGSSLDPFYGARRDPWSTKASRVRALRSRVVLEQEWAAFDRWHDRAVKLARLPFTQRASAAPVFALELERSWTHVAKSLLADIHELMVYAETVEARTAAFRMLTAAHLYRLEKGVFPLNAERLRPVLKGLPADPFLDRKKPLAYSAQPDEATVSWGRPGSETTAAPSEGK